jgi:uncharacterized membrane protein
MRKKNTPLRNLLVLVILFLVVFEVIDSFRNHNLVGIALSIGSIIALIITVRLARKLIQANTESEKEKENPL